MNRNVILGLAMLGAVLLEAPASAAIWYVNADIAIPGSGTSWATAADDIQDIAPPSLQFGDEIRIAGGTVTPYSATVTAYDGVWIRGGFPPTGNPGDDVLNPGVNQVVIDATGSNVGLEVVNGASEFTIIEGLTIKNAGVFGIVNGANSRAIFRHLTLKENGGNSSASGAFDNGIDYAFARVEFCVFEDNVGTSGGAAFRNPETSSFLIEHSTFRGNEAVYGGAIQTAGLEVPCPLDPPCDPQPIPTVRLCYFEENEATDFAGAIYSDGDLMVLASVLKDNTAVSKGGAIQMNEGRLILQDTSFVSNKVTNGYGGAIEIDRGCLLSAHSCLFAKNEVLSGGDGGAVYALFINTTLFQNCTVTENDAATYGGIYIDAGEYCEAGPVEVRVENSILWNNFCDSVPCGTYDGQLRARVASVDDAAVVNYSDLEDLASSPYTAGTGNIGLDPEFIDPFHLNWRLKLVSPCIDSASGEVIPQDTADADADSRLGCDGCNIENNGEHIPDLDLARRFIDIPAVSDINGVYADDHCPLECEIAPDMGAYERVACADCETAGDINGDGLLNGLDIHPFTQCAILASAAEIACLCGDFSGPAGVPDSVVDWYDVPCFIELLLTQAHSCSGPILCGSELQAITDCNGNDIPDGMDIAFSASQDCNKNGVPDECDLESESSLDVNSNDIPDECETDCDNDTIPDAWAIAEELVADINENGVPDTCDPDCDADGEPDDYELDHGADDCNSNGVPDSCEDDCNSNGVPDDCDVDPLDPDGDASVSEDCNQNGIPDTCDLSRSLLPSFDCNNNQVPDECDIASESSEDANENGIPDECEEESLWGGGESMMSGEGGGEFDADAAWTEFFEWYSEQVFGDPGDWHTLTGPERFQRVMDELALLGLPIAAPW